LVVLLGRLLGVLRLVLLGPAVVLATAGVDREGSARMEGECVRGQMGAKLGFVRVGFSYFISEEVFEYIVEAVHLVAEHGWKLLPLYRFDPASGLWRHRAAPAAPTLADVAIPRALARPDHALVHHLEEARIIVRIVEAVPPPLAESDPPIGPELEQIRWFPLPGDAVARLRRSCAA
jgi:hypothetical protein